MTGDQETKRIGDSGTVAPAPRPPASARGLSEAEANRLRNIHGENRLSEAKTVSPLRILFRSFQSPLVLILIVASGLAAALGETLDAAAILAIVVLNGVLGFVQEWRAERAIEALRDMLAPLATVIRDGVPRTIPAVELVPGDLVELAEGQKVPADLTLAEAHGLRLDESVLTGESVPIDRTASDPDPVVFMGTLVVGGRAEGHVAAIGAQTRFGQIADLTGSVGEKSSHLQRQMARLSRQLTIAGVTVALVILITGVLGGRDWFDMVLTALSMAVAVVPEGLPVVVTLTLAIGASAMARRKALLRRLQAAETLGAASVICTDKTGTLTENKMTATIVAMPHARYDVTGTGYDPAGKILRDSKPVRAADDAELARLLRAAQLCNNARLQRNDGWAVLGDPTEGALITLAYKAWADIPDPEDRLTESPFSSERKRMGVIAREGAGCALYVKGAPEAILDASTQLRDQGTVRPMTPEDFRRLEQEHEGLAEQGLRVIAIAERPAENASDTEEARLVFLGFAGLLDPPRPEVKPAVALCRSAGIRVVMITGDSLKTARAIAGLVGIGDGRAVSGSELDAMTDDQLDSVLADEVLFARTAPRQKMRIVDRLQRAGGIVAMTGDGVNDAPALRKADIGMAMGERGTDAAKEAADLVILDDNFATIVRAIEEGRRQFANIRKFVRYLLSSNSAEVIALTLNLLIGGPLIFFPIQILWLNLLTDSVSALALALEPSEPGQMEHPPLDKEEQVLNAEGALWLAGVGAYMGTISLALFYGFQPQGEALARTVAFTALVICQEIVVFAFRSDTQSAWRLGFFSNPWLVVAATAMLGLQALAVYWPPMHAVLGTVPLAPSHLAIAFATAVPLIFAPTLFKFVRRLRRG